MEDFFRNPENTRFFLMKSVPPYWEPMREMFYEMMGHPEKDKELWEKVSLIFHADKIKIPMLVAQGANDPRVNKGESDQIVEALKARGIEVEYMVKENEGHGFRNEEEHLMRNLFLRTRADYASIGLRQFASAFNSRDSEKGRLT